jgi:hypothetical protein
MGRPRPQKEKTAAALEADAQAAGPLAMDSRVAPKGMARVVGGARSSKWA